MARTAGEQEVKHMLIPVTGRTGSGKSEYILRELNRLSLEGKKCLLLVPEQFSFQAEKRTLMKTDRRAQTGIEVISFSHMANRLTEKYRPSHLPFISARGKTLLMGAALDDLHERLSVYGNVRDRRKLAARLLETDASFKQNRLPVESLFDMAERTEDSAFHDKLSDLGLILNVYNAMLSQSYSDSATSLSQAAELLALVDDYDGFCVAVDEFSGFTADELAVLEQLMRKAERTYLSLCLDRPQSPSGTVFALPNESFTDILSIAQKNNIPVRAPVVPGAPRYPHEDIAYCEQFLFDFSPEPFGKDAPHVTVCKCDNKAQECEYAALTAKKLIREKHYRCRDIAVIERTSGSYAPDLAMAFRRCGIPVFRDMRRSIACEPPVAYLLAFLELACLRFSTDAVMRFLKSGMTDFSPDDIHALDNYVLMYAVDGSEWQKVWKWNPKGLGEALDDRSRQALDRLNGMREQIVACVLAFREKIDGQNCAAVTREAYHFLSETHVEDKLRAFAARLAENGEPDEADTVIAAWNELSDCLSDMHDVTGGRFFSPARWYELFSDIVVSSAAGVSPSYLDAVSVGSADRVRLTDVKAVIVVGVNEGVFPAAPVATDLFTDSERRQMAQMGFDVGNDTAFLSNRESYISYKVFSYASEYLFVTCSKRDASGAKLLPSEIVVSLEKLLPPGSFTEFSLVPTLDRIAGRESAFRYLAGHFLSDAPEVTALVSCFSTGADSARVAALERLACGVAPAFADPSKTELLYGRHMTASPTAMETYFSCPFRYFCQYGLRARPRTKAALTAALNGTVIHYILQRIFDEVGSERLPSLSEDDMRARATSCLEEFIQSCLPGIEEKSERMRTLIRSYIDNSVGILKRLAAEFADSRFVTSDTELRLGGDQMDAYRVHDPSGGSLGITGIVDRVDIFRQDDRIYLRVVDYKTDGKIFHLCDVFEGLNMQMLIYLVCLWRNGANRYGGEITPAGILYVPAQIGETALDRNAAESDIQKQDEKNARMNGLLLDDPLVLSAMGATDKPRFLPAYLDADGVGHGSVLSLHQFETLHRLIDDKLREMSAGIHGGNIQPLPIGGEGHEDTCEYCRYRSVCLHEADGATRTLAPIPDAQLYKILSGEDANNG